MTQASLCADPERYDGHRVSVEGPIDAQGGSSLRGCCCCNSGWKNFQLACDEGDIVLIPGDGLETTPMPAEHVDPYPGTVEGRGIQLGCDGQECFMQCNPARPEHIERVAGIFRASEIDYDPGYYETLTYAASLEVESITVVDLSDDLARTEDDCGEITDADDALPCEGDFVCALDDGRLAHCICDRL